MVDILYSRLEDIGSMKLRRDIVDTLVNWNYNDPCRMFFGGKDDND